MSAERLREWLRGQLAELLTTDPDLIGDDDRFAGLGLDSLRATSLASALSEEFGARVSPALLWAHPSVGALSQYLAQGRRAEATVAEYRTDERPGARSDEPVAVVGMACRLPGADGLDAFWELLRSGIDAVRPVPEDRWTADEHAGVPSEAGFLSAPVDRFDPLFFGISPREAAEMDPQQRLFLEVAWEALEQAGLSKERLRCSRTGVFAGAIWHDFADLCGTDDAPPTSHSATGQALNMVANRLSYTLGLRGPSLTLDSACSSSLLAVHLACRSLLEGECDAAVAGGVNLLLSPATMEALTRFGGLSPDGRCKAFDARGDGFGRGEGCGVVVLKPLSRALADGDRIWSLIRGSAVNNDGPSNGLTAPDPLAQEDVLRRAYGRAGVDPHEVHLVETHGTGTALGDPIEASALGAVLGGAHRAEPLRIGAVKTNVGHLEGAAGITGLIKAVLCLHHRSVPPNLHFDVPNPHIDFAALALRVPTELEEWPAGRRLAGVSSFGWGGTNVHAVLEGWNEPEPLPDTPELTTPEGKEHARVAFVCAPHGHQWVGMARHMLRSEPVFRAAVERCDRELARHTGWSVLDVLHVEAGRADYDDVSVTQPVLFSVQVALAAWLEHRGVRPDVVAGHSLGEIAAAVIAGFLDIPEAARVVHHYSRHQARIAGRGEGMAVVELSAAELGGDPAVAFIRPTDGTDRTGTDADGYTDGGRLVIAAHNGPGSTVVAGPVAELEALLARLKARGVLASMVRVNVAAHSPAIDEIVPDLIDDLGELSVAPGRIPMLSTVTARPLTAGELDAVYFARNLREPVRLAEATGKILADGCAALVEISAHPVLSAALQQSARQAGDTARVLATMVRADDDRAGPWAALTELAALGALRPPAQSTDTAELVTLSAATGSALREAAARTAEVLERAPSVCLPAVVAAARCRAGHPYRLAVVARTPKEVAEALRRHAGGVFAGGVHSAARPVRAPKVVFVFPGQGSQWVGMARELLASEPVFAAAVRRCDAALAPHLDWSILTELQAEEADARLDRIDVVQPLLFTMEVALAELWSSWGVRPDAVIGHSMGEVAAAYVAGAVSLEDAARVISLRSRLMCQASGQGAMLAVELTGREAAEAVGARSGLVSVAVSNSRRSTVLSGDRTALEEIADELTRREIFCRWVKVDVASHSPQMDPLREDLLGLLDGVSGRAPRVPMHSTVTGRPCSDGDFDADYWFRNLRLPVLFGDRVEELVGQGHTVFVEMSPHPILLPAVQQAARDANGTAEARVVPSLRRGEPARDVLLDSLGALYVMGVPVDLERAATPARPSHVLPPYPWQRDCFPVRRSGAGVRRGVAGVLGERLDAASEPGSHYWQFTLQRDSWMIGDHVIDGASVAPGAVILELALQAARQVLPAGTGFTCTEVRFRAPLVVGEGGTRVQLVLRRKVSMGVTREVPTDGERAGTTAEPSSESCSEAWVRFFVGAACVAETRITATAPTATGQLDVSVAEERLAQGVPGPDYYSRLARRGLAYGPAYRRVQRVATGATEALSRLGCPSAEPDAPAPGTRLLDPAQLDAALQTALAPLLDSLPEGTGLVSAAIERLVVHGRLSTEGYAHASVRPFTHGFLADVRLHDVVGEPLVEATGVTLLRRRIAVANTHSPVRTEADGDVQSRTDGPNAQSVRDSLLRIADGDRRRAALETHITSSVAAVARIPADETDLDLPLRSYGIDSLMTLELRNLLEARFGIGLDPALITKHPTVRLLAPVVADLAGIPFPGRDASPVSAPENTKRER
ncbi:acyltransferase domain-containing protein [Streptomyces olivaceiscleroticus]|uniref:acyltransferase domain-containing protein n=1 Tax=Streptomyces olivaceiscleroticus TaxID=68245 RepID=UPI0031F78C9C